MGRKRKVGSIADDDDGEVKKEDSNIFDDGNIQTKSKSNKKNKKSIHENSNATKSTEETLQTEENPNSNSAFENSRRKKKLKNDPAGGDDPNKALIVYKNKGPTKIRFIDDAPQVVAGSSQQSTLKKKNQPNEEEEEVNDEDIDKFCDELTEEDNVQFDNWVKLIEANLHSKKNK